MAATRIGQFRDRNPEVNTGATLPLTRTVYQDAQVASTTKTIRFYPDAAGRMRALNVFGTITGTVSVNLLKNGTTVLSGVVTLASATRCQLRAFGSAALTTAGGPFNTDSDINRAKLDYEVGDYLEISLVTAAASTIATLQVELVCDEQQRSPFF